MNPTPYTVLIGGNNTLILERRLDVTTEINAAITGLAVATVTVTTAVTDLTVAIQSIPPMKVNVQ